MYLLPGTTVPPYHVLSTVYLVYGVTVSSLNILKRFPHTHKLQVTSYKLHGTAQHITYMCVLKNIRNRKIEDIDGVEKLRLMIELWWIRSPDSDCKWVATCTRL
ncbi:unnamed protein product [Ambrosiozyma monospora]|uniref:Unnamed protein product n=1 Tax=Ambrosiozyma monospora TaxID=43982 RepID=A0A9W6YYR2_AMBMO|nr:unnamed protein product [Ambrosiozyma monospora]